VVITLFVKLILILSQVAVGSSQLSKFSTHHLQHAHEQAQYGQYGGAMPRMEEVEEMLAQQRKVQEALNSIKDALAMQQSAYDRRNEHGSVDYDMDDAGSIYHDEGKNLGGSAIGNDPKKRRGVCYSHLLITIQNLNLI
jgi:predicted O-linked N-acetylglucosamine transferase (SPINDLY family)